jgi:hypothetical protein
VGRHAYSIANPTQIFRLGALVLVWLAGLIVGIFGMICVGARYASCSSTNNGLACHSSGTTLSVLLIVGVIATVTVVTVATHGRDSRALAVLTVAGLVVLGMLYVGTRAILATV